VDAVSVSPEVEAEILRLHHAEKWRPNTIARELGVHHSVVARVVRQEGQPKAARRRPSKLDSFVPFIEESFRRWPKLCASRLYQMCCERGYRGSESHFRHFVRPLRPKPKAEAYLRLRTLPGEQAQVDWADFGAVEVGRATRRLVAFVMVLSFSRRVFLHFFFDQRTENFLRGHELAFAAFGGSVRTVLYDNLKSCVLERRGDAIRFHPLLLAFAAHHRFEPRPVAVARGNEKGRVERSISYIRRSFFAARAWRDIDDLNAQAKQWCEGVAFDRPWVEDRRMTVREAFEKERSLLLPLPDSLFPTDERREVSVQKSPYCRFDGNDYSVPPEYVRRTLVVLASLSTVRISDEAGRAIAAHTRCFSKGEVIENPAHVERLARAKRRAREHRSLDRLQRSAPSTQDLLGKLAERGEPLGRATARLLTLLDEFGARELEAAVREAIARGVPHDHAVRHILDRRRHEHGRLPGIAVRLPDDPRVRELSVEPHRLETYDELGSPDESKQDDE
jgi:transposase